MILQGDCLEVLKTLDASSVDSLVTDPPAGIGFMGKHWDSDKGGRDAWVAWLTSVMRECYRVLKPGAHGLVWAIPRTSHWTATALENAGFEIRDVVTHLFGTGFPKSHDVSKAIDKAAGAERPVVGNKAPASTNRVGWGTALKPASEHWILVRKPLSEKTVAANVLKHGTGGINIDASRIATSEVLSIGSGKSNTYGQASSGDNPGQQNALGRFPANLVLSHNDDCELVGTKKVKGAKPTARDKAAGFNPRSEGLYGSSDGVTECTGYAAADGTETVQAWQCTPGCAVAALDEQSGVLKSGGTGGGGKTFHGVAYDRPREVKVLPNEGGASRFFYCAKASKKERGEGNDHPTVKSTALMRYLVRLITPPKGIVLDPFMGSGSTGVAAASESFGFVGIEMDPSYFAISDKRIGGVR